MKFDQPRVFEANYPGHGIYRVEIVGEQEAGVARHISNSNVGVVWTLSELLENPHFWREVTPFDVTKLDTAGVFHEVPKKAPVMRHYYRKDDPDYILSNPGPLIDRQSQFIEFPRPDIANARIAQLENLFQRAEDRAEFEYKCRVEAAVKKYEHYENCKAELRDQMTKAWMRNDLTTADRIADLIGDKRPSEHEAAGAKAEVQA